MHIYADFVVHSTLGVYGKMKMSPRICRSMSAQKSEEAGLETLMKAQRKGGDQSSAVDLRCRDEAHEAEGQHIGTDR